MNLESKITHSEYICIHLWLVRHYGKASICEARSCSGVSKKFDWALRRGMTYTRDLDCFYQLCRSCHVKYDKGADMEFGHYELSQIPDGRTSKHLRKPIVCVENNSEFNSTIEASRNMNIPRQSISHVLNGRRKKAYGFTFRFT